MMNTANWNPFLLVPEEYKKAIYETEILPFRKRLARASVMTGLSLSVAICGIIMHKWLMLLAIIPFLLFLGVSLILKSHLKDCRFYTESQSFRLAHFVEGVFDEDAKHLMADTENTFYCSNTSKLKDGQRFVMINWTPRERTSDSEVKVYPL